MTISLNNVLEILGIVGFRYENGSYVEIPHEKHIEESNTYFSRLVPGSTGTYKHVILKGYFTEKDDLSWVENLRFYLRDYPTYKINYFLREDYIKLYGLKAMFVIESSKDKMYFRLCYQNHPDIGGLDISEKLFCQMFSNRIREEKIKSVLG